MMQRLATWAAFAGAILLGLAIWQVVIGAYFQAAILGIAGAAGFLWGGKKLYQLEQGEVPPDLFPAPTPAPGHEAATEEPLRFSVHRSFDDRHLGAIAAVLEADPRIESVVEEAGRHYSAPDGDDLPEWFALRVYCAPGVTDFDETRAAIEGLIHEKLGQDVLDAVTVQGF